VEVAVQSSSTSSSERTGAGRERLLVGLGILLVFVFAEVGARVVESGFGHNGDWPSNETFVKHEQLATLGSVDTVYAGSSFVAFGIDSRLASEQTGDAHYNAGLSAAQFDTTDVWLREFVVPKVSPQRVVLGFGHKELDGSSTGNSRRFLEAPAIAQALDPTALRSAEEVVQEVSVLFRNRRQIRDIRDLGRAITQPDFPEFWGSAGERQDDFSEVRVLDVEGATASEPSVERVALLGSLIEWLQEADVDVVLVLMPTADGFLPADFGNQTAEVLTEVAEESGARFIDGRGLASDAKFFFDGAHLNPEGQDAFTRALLQELPDQ